MNSIPALFFFLYPNPRPVCASALQHTVTGFLWLVPLYSCSRALSNETITNCDTHKRAHTRTTPWHSQSHPSLCVSEWVSGSWPPCLCHARFFRHYCFLIGGEGHPYHCGNCRGIYWGGGSWAAVAVGTRAGGFFSAAHAEMSFKSIKDLGVSAERIGSFCKRWMNRVQRSVSVLSTSNLFSLSVAAL